MAGDGKNSCGDAASADGRGIVAIPAWLVLGANLGLSTEQLGLFFAIAFLVALFSAAGGLDAGMQRRADADRIGVQPGAGAHDHVRLRILSLERVGEFSDASRAVLINPLVYASEGLRGTLAPQYPHMPSLIVIAVLGAIDVVLVFAALNRFRNKAVS